MQAIYLTRTVCLLKNSIFCICILDECKDVPLAGNTFFFSSSFNQTLKQSQLIQLLTLIVLSNAHIPYGIVSHSLPFEMAKFLGLSLFLSKHSYVDIFCLIKKKKTVRRGSKISSLQENLKI